jgi:hypothetical protein
MTVALLLNTWLLSREFDHWFSFVVVVVLAVVAKDSAGIVPEDGISIVLVRRVISGILGRQFLSVACFSKVWCRL